MAGRRHLTILFIPDGARRTRAFRVRYGVLRFLLFCLVAGSLISLAFFLRFSEINARAFTAGHLFAKNLALIEKQKQLDSLEVALVGMQKQARAVENVLGEFLGRPPTADAVAGRPVAGLLAPRDILNYISKVDSADRRREVGPVLPTAFTPNLWPVAGIITRNYRPGHPGLDLIAAAGALAVASADGIVAAASWDGQYGNAALLRHGPWFETFYAHLDRLFVRPGDHVRKGQAIGVVGSTGNSTGPHLHFEVRKKGKPVDPMNYLSK